MTTAQNTTSSATIDKEQLKSEIANAYDGFINELKQLDAKTLNTRPREGAWTPGQITHHIIRGTREIPDEQTEKPARPFDQNVKQLADIFLNFESKMESPDFILPGDGPFDGDKLINTLAEIKKGHLTLIDTKDLTELCTTFEFPFIGFLTRYEWVRFITFHVQRHLRQLKNCREEIARQ